jgi:hypothetical protein
MIHVVQGQAAFDPSKVELCRQLLQQFHEDSVGRYGLDHKLVRLFSQLLIPTDSAAIKQSPELLALVPINLGCQPPPAAGAGRSLGAA